MTDKAEFWTTEQVAEHLGITKQDIYESARRNEFPGNVGVQRGRRKLYRSDLILAGPQEPETTNDPMVALLWTAQGIEAKLSEILRELRAQAPYRVEWIPPTIELTTEGEDDDGEE